MNDELSLLVSDECDRLLAELRSISSNPILSKIQDEIISLKLNLFTNHFQISQVLSPFEKIITDEQTTDFITSLALSSVNTFISFNLLQSSQDVDSVCNTIKNCQFQSTSDFDCAAVSYRILTCIISLCRTNLLNSNSLLIMLDYVMTEIKNSDRNISPILIDALSSISTYIFRKNINDVFLIESLLTNLYFLCQCENYYRQCGLFCLLQISRITSNRNDSLMAVTCSLFHKFLLSIDSRDNFVLILRLFTHVFIDKYMIYPLPFSRCFDELLNFVEPTNKIKSQQNTNSQSQFQTLNYHLRTAALEVISDFISQPNFLLNLFVNLNSRTYFPNLFDKLVKVYFSNLDKKNRILKLNLPDIKMLTNNQHGLIFSLNKKEIIENFNQEKDHFSELEKFSEKFNENPSYYIKNSGDFYTPHKIASFLIESPNLSRKQIGEFFAKRKPFCMETLQNYLELLDFSNLDFDSSIRLFLSGFQIAGEGQIVDRIFEYFSKRFFACGSDKVHFKSPESVHILAYGWLMIHTSFHNNNVTKKPIFSDFCKMMEKQNNGENFDSDFLNDIFESVKNVKVPFEESEQEGSVAHWRLLMCRQKLANFKFVTFPKIEAKTKNQSGIIENENDQAENKNREEKENQTKTESENQNQNEIKIKFESENQNQNEIKTKFESENQNQNENESQSKAEIQNKIENKTNSKSEIQNQNEIKPKPESDTEIENTIVGNKNNLNNDNNNNEPTKNKNDDVCENQSELNKNKSGNSIKNGEEDKKDDTIDDINLSNLTEDSIDVESQTKSTEDEARNSNEAVENFSSHESEKDENHIINKVKNEETEVDIQKEIEDDFYFLFEDDNKSKDSEQIETEKAKEENEEFKKIEKPIESNDEITFDSILEAIERESDNENEDLNKSKSDSKNESCNEDQIALNEACNSSSNKFSNPLKDSQFTASTDNQTASSSNLSRESSESQFTASNNQLTDSTESQTQNSTESHLSCQADDSKTSIGSKISSPITATQSENSAENRMQSQFDDSKISICSKISSPIAATQSENSAENRMQSQFDDGKISDSIESQVSSSIESQSANSTESRSPSIDRMVENSSVAVSFKERSVSEVPLSRSLSPSKDQKESIKNDTQTVKKPSNSTQSSCASFLSDTSDSDFIPLFTIEREMFHRIWNLESAKITDVCISSPSVLNSVITSASVFGMCDIVDSFVMLFSKNAVEELLDTKNAKKESSTSSLFMLGSVATFHSDSIRCDGWTSYIKLLTTLLDLDLLNDEILTFKNVAEDMKPVVLCHKLVNSRSRRRNSMFSLFLSSRPSFDDLKRSSSHSNLRDFVSKSGIERFIENDINEESLISIVRSIINVSREVQSDVDADKVRVAFCVILIEKVVTEKKKIESFFSDKKVLKTVTDEFFVPFLSSKKSGSFLSTLFFNETFVIVLDLWSIEWLQNDLVYFIDKVFTSLQISQSEVQVDMIEKCLSLFLEKNFESFIQKQHLKGILNLIQVGLFQDSIQSFQLFERFANISEGDFENVRFPLIQVKSAIILVENQKWNQSHDKTKRLNSIQTELKRKSFSEMKPLIFVKQTSSKQWERLFNDVLFPLTMKRVRYDDLILLILETFEFALNKLCELPLFESMWFRLLSLTLEFAKRCDADVKDQIEARLSGCILQMKKLMILADSESKICCLTKSNVEKVFPLIDVI